MVAVHFPPQLIDRSAVVEDFASRDVKLRTIEAADISPVPYPDMAPGKA